MPAGTGVCVVKTTRARAARQAASKLAPSSIALGDELEAGEDRMALVEVVRADAGWRQPQRARAADAEQHLLGDPAVGPGIVEPPRDPQVPGLGRLEEVERHDRVSAHAPHAALDPATGDADRDADARVLEEVGTVLVPFVHGLARRIDALGRVALGPAEPDADDGQPEVVGALQEVAGEDAEPARVGSETPRGARTPSRSTPP